MDYLQHLTGWIDVRYTRGSLTAVAGYLCGAAPATGHGHETFNQ
ncbi:hypothetical protein [Arthrobacter sp. AD-310]